MNADSIKFRGHRCFKKEWSGFESIKPINVIIGRNNTGKSHLLDLAAALCENKLKDRGWQYKCCGLLDEQSLRRVFPANTSRGELGGNFWEDHGKFFVGAPITWESDDHFQATNIEYLNGFKPDSRFGPGSTKARHAAIREVLTDITHRLAGSVFRRLLADRDIRPEAPETQLDLLPDGAGATNIIRRYIVTSNPKYPREIIQKDLLAALNAIFCSDGHFTEIQVKCHDESKTEKGDEPWEVFLGEEKKGLIPLSKSGSGLKTVLLVLLNLLVIPEIQEKAKSHFVFAFEEIENNLHPALLRRLFQYLENYAVCEKSVIFLTTHSSVAVDLFGVSNNAQIIHVTHDGEAACATTVSAHFDRLGVISELGARPSDLLQANGIIWVEGPSDRIYINRWIELIADGKLLEGRDYQCAFYGGSLLARTQFVPPDQVDAELVNLFHINPNIVVICDSDRSAASGKGSTIKDRVQRISDELRAIPGAHIWVTDAKEIENYLTGSVLGNVFKIEGVPDPGQYDAFFPSEDVSKSGASYVEAHLKRRSIDKTDLAVQAAAHMTKEVIQERFDLKNQVNTIIEHVKRWNS